MTTRAMRALRRLTCATGAIIASGGIAHAAAQGAPSSAAQASQVAAIARARADSVSNPYTAADVQFVAGMIHHHAQAIVMSGWAPTHGADPRVQTLAARIINSQRDEIHLMQQWLRDRRQAVPEVDSAGHMAMAMAMPMPGATHEMLMPGMLTDAQMHQLDQAQGPEFDRQFLTFMIQHHRGAISMVQDLFNTYGAAQDQTVFKLASDINVDQTTEIARMQKMLVSLLFQSPATGR